LAPWPSNDWQLSEKQVLVLTPEQALSSKALVIITTLKRVEIIFQVPGGKRGDSNAIPYPKTPIRQTL
jgi:hypothetical protein